MNHHSKLCENVELYALGGLDDEERKAFESHLTTCVQCTAELAELTAIVDQLPLASEQVEPPSGMRDRILGHILGDGFGQNNDSADKVSGSEQAADNEAPATIAAPSVIHFSIESVTGKQTHSIKRRLRPAWAIIALSAAVLLLFVYCLSLRTQVSDLNRRLEDSSVPPQGVRPNEAVSLSSAAQNIVANGLATIVIDRKGTHLLVQAEKLPELKGNEAFQVWLMKDGQDVVNAGTFLAREGKGGLYLTLDKNLSGYDQIAITQEPDAYGVTPRGTAVLTGSISL
ncbi:anti-sigma factor [Paenibacillus glycanilyticus]|uniref:anti-sigma factor n=1 Tax=Paenibacillus glycanilyticus TaxID=126569 RepID=UPI000FD7C007|nr:anti-sigma factor [Paenibacillus glycanilyticus]